MMMMTTMMMQRFCRRPRLRPCFWPSKPAFPSSFRPSWCLASRPRAPPTMALAASPAGECTSPTCGGHRLTSGNFQPCCPSSGTRTACRPGANGDTDPAHPMKKTKRKKEKKKEKEKEKSVSASLPEPQAQSMPSQSAEQPPSANARSVRRETAESLGCSGNEYPSRVASYRVPKA